MSNIKPNDEEFLLSGSDPYQYVKLKDIVNAFMLTYIGDDKVFPPNTKRFNVVYHAKRGLQELTYDALREVKVAELELNDVCSMRVPSDYVNYVRISWVDNEGYFHPIIESTDTAIVTSAYLQDNKFEILFDNTGEALEGSSLSRDRSLNNGGSSVSTGNSGRSYMHYSSSPDYGLDASKANGNGHFVINKQMGVIEFSSDLKNKLIVLEYISDGLEGGDEERIEVHKFAEQCLINYIAWQLTNSKINMPEYLVARFRREYFTQLTNTKIRLSNFKGDTALQLVKGSRTWLKEGL